MTGASELAYWLDVTADLLRHPLTEFPAAELAVHLNHSFELSSLSWEWRETEDLYGCGHMRWFVGENFESHGCEHQLSIPYWIQGVSHATFVLARVSEDFSPDEQDLARRLRPLLAGLYVQVRAQGGSGGPAPPGSAAQTSLTGTEVAVLSLLARGYTAHCIARRLSNSPRTVHKHLEHIYRKLGVRDRLMAVRVAGELGIGPRPDVHRDDMTDRVAGLAHGGPDPA